MSRPSRGSLVCLLALTVGCSETPTAPTDVVTPPIMETFSSSLTTGGASSRSFVAGGPGEVDVVLVSTMPAGLRVGIGIGIPRDTGRGCSLDRAIVASAAEGARLAATVEPGEFCVEVYDVGDVTLQSTFTVTIEHP